MKNQVICNKLNTKHCLRVKEDLGAGDYTQCVRKDLSDIYEDIEKL